MGCVYLSCNPSDFIGKNNFFRLFELLLFSRLKPLKFEEIGDIPNFESESPFLSDFRHGFIISFSP
jgi:hypothetical protein